MIKFEKIFRIYQLGQVQIEALQGISLEIERGSFVAIMGPSGSGKSTLLHIMGCLDRPSLGRYFLDGKDVSLLSDRQLARVRNQQIGFVFQAFNLLWNETAVGNVMLPLIYASANDKKRRVVEALREVGLEHRLKHKPGEMSGGEQQRVAIARAMVKNPDIILADEPTGNLDSEAGHHIMETFEHLNSRGVTIVIITHEKTVAERCRKIIHLKDGQIVAE